MKARSISLPTKGNCEVISFDEVVSVNLMSNFVRGKTRSPAKTHLSTIIRLQQQLYLNNSLANCTQKLYCNKIARQNDVLNRVNELRISGRHNSAFELEFLLAHCCKSDH